MINNHINALHISHNDLDGYAATTLTSLIAKAYPTGLFNLDLMHIIPKNLMSTVKSVINEINNYDIVVITDLAISPAVADLIESSGYKDKFRVMDHHESACEPKYGSWLNINKYSVPRSSLTNEEYASGYYTNDEHTRIPLTCGTELYYNFIKNDDVFDLNLLNLEDNSKALKYLVSVVKSYDTFAFDNDDSEISIVSQDAPRLNTLFYTIPHEDFEEYIDDYIHSRGIMWMNLTSSSKAYPWISKVIDLQEISKEKYIKSALKKMQIVDFNKNFYKNGTIHEVNLKFGVTFAEKNGPMIGKAARDNGIDIDVCAVVTNNQVSLYRVNDNVDVSAIASYLGGGGHKAAAGFTLPYYESNKINISHFFEMVNTAGNLA